MPRNIKTLIVVRENNTTMSRRLPRSVRRGRRSRWRGVKRPARTLLLEDLPPTPKPL